MELHEEGFGLQRVMTLQVGNVPCGKPQATMRMKINHKTEPTKAKNTKGQFIPVASSSALAQSEMRPVLRSLLSISLSTF